MDAFRMGFPHVKRGGYYCIEDLHSFASPQHCDAPENVMQWLTRIATEMQARGADASARVLPSDVWHDIDTSDLN